MNIYLRKNINSKSLKHVGGKRKWFVLQLYVQCFIHSCYILNCIYQVEITMLNIPRAFKLLTEVDQGYRYNMLKYGENVN